MPPIILFYYPGYTIRVIVVSRCTSVHAMAGLIQAASRTPHDNANPFLFILGMIGGRDLNPSLGFSNRVLVFTLVALQLNSSFCCHCFRRAIRLRRFVKVAAALSISTPCAAVTGRCYFSHTWWVSCPRPSLSATLGYSPAGGSGGG
jgi:hypothetical protein